MYCIGFHILTTGVASLKTDASSDFRLCQCRDDPQQDVPRCLAAYIRSAGVRVGKLSRKWSVHGQRDRRDWERWAALELSHRFPVNWQMSPSGHQNNPTLDILFIDPNREPKWPVETGAERNKLQALYQSLQCYAGGGKRPGDTGNRCVFNSPSDIRCSKSLFFKSTMRRLFHSRFIALRLVQTLLWSSKTERLTIRSVPCQFSGVQGFRCQILSAGLWFVVYSCRENLSWPFV